MRIIGVDVGVKGAYFTKRVHGVWDASHIKEHRDVVTAQQRASFIRNQVLQMPYRDAVLFVLDEPVFIQGKAGWQHGLQCTLFGALVGELRGATGRYSSVLTMPGVRARHLVGVKGSGKQAIVEWARANGLENSLQGLPKWKLETVAEAAMLAQAGAIYQAHNQPSIDWDQVKA